MIPLSGSFPAGNHFLDQSLCSDSASGSPFETAAPAASTFCFFVSRGHRVDEEDPPSTTRSAADRSSDVSPRRAPRGVRIHPDKILAQVLFRGDGGAPNESSPPPRARVGLAPVKVVAGVPVRGTAHRIQPLPPLANRSPSSALCDCCFGTGFVRVMRGGGVGSVRGGGDRRDC